MNNTIDLFDTTPASLTLREKSYGDADFDVQYHSLYAIHKDLNGNADRTQLIPNRVVSIREDTQDVLGIHSLKYKGVNFKDGIDRCREIIIKSDLADDSIIEDIGVTPNSRQCIVSYVLPNVLIDTPDGDQAELMIVMANSFNGVWAFSIRVGLRLMACLNGMLSNTNGLIYKSRHNSRLNLDHAVSVISNSLPILYEQTELWREWLATPCSTPDVLKIIGTVTDNKYLINNHKDTFVDVLNDDETRRSRNIAHLWDAWSRYQRTLGPNMWAMYNTLTDWSTHVEGINNSKPKKYGSIANIRTRRESIVDKVISDPDLFQQKVA
tara:strand:- start:357 stop:1328 length:972 start_codon:yes stop_codon:yes gene_type:complete